MPVDPGADTGFSQACRPRVPVLYREERTVSGEWLRKAIWLAGAIAFVLSYRIALAAVPLDIPDDFAHRLLLSVSGLAACMAGGAGAILVYDRFRDND